MGDSLLPKIMQDESNLTLEKCAQYAFDIDLKPLMIYCFDHVKSQFLPMLAEQFHILGDEGWNFAQTEEEKRNLLKTAFEIHRYKGTKYALKQVLKAFNIDGDIKEWFEYSGKPFYFKVILNIKDKVINDDLEKNFVKLINEVKNVRSVLEKLEYIWQLNATLTLLPLSTIEEIIFIPSKMDADYLSWNNAYGTDNETIWNTNYWS